MPIAREGLIARLSKCTSSICTADLIINCRWRHSTRVGNRRRRQHSAAGAVWCWIHRARM